MRIYTLFLVFLLALVFAVNTTAQVDSAARPSQKVVPPASDPGWQPTPQQRDLVEKTTRDYFAAQDGNRSDEAYSRLSPRQKQYLPFADYRRSLEDFNAMSGQVQGRQLRAVTWYKDNPQAGPGLYVAVDYSSQFENLVLHCGYLIWHEQPDGSFLLVREEINMIDKETAAELKPEDLQRIRSRFRC